MKTIKKKDNNVKFMHRNKLNLKWVNDARSSQYRVPFDKAIYVYKFYLSADCFTFYFHFLIKYLKWYFLITTFKLQSHQSQKGYNFVIRQSIGVLLFLCD